METGLEGKPWYYGAGVGAVLVVALVAVGYYVKFQQMGLEIKRQEGALTELEKKIKEGEAAKRQLPQFNEEVERLEVELEKLLRILPSRRGTEDLLRRVRALTEQGDFHLQRFNPRPPNPLDDFYSEWPIEIELEGTYHNLALFFDRISRFSRIINIEDLKIRPLGRGGEDSLHTIGARFTAKTFLANEQEEEEGGGEEG